MSKRRPTTPSRFPKGFKSGDIRQHEHRSYSVFYTEPAFHHATSYNTDVSQQSECFPNFHLTLKDILEEVKNKWTHYDHELKIIAILVVPLLAMIIRPHISSYVNSPKPSDINYFAARNSQIMQLEKYLQYQSMILGSSNISTDDTVPANTAYSTWDSQPVSFIHTETTAGENLDEVCKVGACESLYLQIRMCCATFSQNGTSLNYLMLGTSEYPVLCEVYDENITSTETIATKIESDLHLETEIDVDHSVPEVLDDLTEKYDGLNDFAQYPSKDPMIQNNHIMEEQFLRLTDAINSLRKKFPNQNIETWIQLYSSLEHVSTQEEPIHPAAITVLIPPTMGLRLPVCFLDIVTRTIQSVPNFLFTSKSSDKNLNALKINAAEMQSLSILDLQTRIQNYFANEGKILITQDVDQIRSEKHLFLYHGIADSTRAMDKRSILLFPVRVPQDIYDKYSWNHEKGRKISYEVFSRAWQGTLRNDNIPALITRIADSVVLLNDEDACGGRAKQIRVDGVDRVKYNIKN